MTLSYILILIALFFGVTGVLVGMGASQGLLTNIAVLAAVVAIAVHLILRV